MQPPESQAVLQRGAAVLASDLVKAAIKFRIDAKQLLVGTFG
jgi:hypothetical protein